MDFPTSQSDGAGPELDLADLERQIQSLLGGGAPEADPKPNAVIDAGSPAITEATPSPEVGPIADATRDVRAESFEEPPIDPLLQEIDAALADDADALLKGANGDVGQALRSVFDERALSGQEEEINRALIEAFGTSRVERPSFGAPPVSNPLPAFDGSARELSPDIPRSDRDRASMAAVEAPARTTEHSAENPPESPLGSPGTPPSAAAAVPAATTVVAAAPTSVSPAEPMPTPAPAKAADPRLVEAKPAAVTPDGAGHASRGSAIRALLELPVRLLGAPMRAMPATARTVLSVAAITLVLWTPVAWWLAQRATRFPAVAPIHIRPAEVVASAESGSSGAAEQPASSGH